MAAAIKKTTFTKLKKTYFPITTMDKKMFLNPLYVMGIKKKSDFKVPVDYIETKSLEYSERKVDYNNTSIIAIKLGCNWFSEEYVNQIKHMINNDVVRVYYSHKDLDSRLIIESNNFVIYLTPLVKEC